MKKILKWVIIILLVGLACVLSRITTYGVIKLITLCFGWTFKWHIATGIWLILILLKSCFSSNSSKN